jgi:hypothetical protein
MRAFYFLLIMLCSFPAYCQPTISVKANPSEYLSSLKQEMHAEWPENRTINLVFHGHSVPAGYFKTPHVNIMSAYPNLVLKKIKSIYPNAVVNVIVTAIGGENSVKGAVRFNDDVLIHRPDVLFIDYGLNDRRAGLAASYDAWNEMIGKAKNNNVKPVKYYGSIIKGITHLGREK